MKLPTLRSLSKQLLGRSSKVLAREGEDRTDKLVVEALRLMSQVFTKLADAVESERLARQGFKDQERFVERTDPNANATRPS